MGTERRPRDSVEGDSRVRPGDKKAPGSRPRGSQASALRVQLEEGRSDDKESPAPGFSRLVRPAVLEMLDDLGELSTANRARASIAVSLAGHLDEAKSSNGAAAMAVSGIAKELRATLDAILESTSGEQEFVADLFSEMGHQEES